MISFEVPISGSRIANSKRIRLDIVWIQNNAHRGIMRCASSAGQIIAFDDLIQFSIVRFFLVFLQLDPHQIGILPLDIRPLFEMRQKQVDFVVQEGIMKNLGRLGSGSGESSVEKQSYPRALPDTLDRIVGQILCLLY